MSVIETIIDIPAEHEKNVCGQFDGYFPYPLAECCPEEWGNLLQIVYVYHTFFHRLPI